MSEQDQLADLLAQVESGLSPEAALDAVCGQDAPLRKTLRRRLTLLADLGVFEGDRPPETPQRLGRFAIQRPLGGGGMGMVYLAWDEELARTVALKVIRPEQLYFERALERFRREVRVIAQLAHPNVVQVYSVGEESGVPYFAMERVIGCSLAEALADLSERDPAELTGRDLQRVVAARAQASRSADIAIDGEEETSPPVPSDSVDDDTVGWLYAGSWEDTCLRIVRQIATALDHAHGRGVLHRDIKPSNIMLTADPGDSRALLLDFGLAGVVGAASLTASGARLGSLPYMPPEQVGGDASELGAQSDIYSLGTTLYESLTLRPAYRGSSDPEILAAIHRGDVDRPTQFHQGLSWEAETVCLTAMEPEAARRYASASELGRDLDNVLGHRPIEARRAGPVLRLRRWVQRHPTATVGLILGALLLLGGPSLYAWQQHSARVAIEAKNKQIEADSQTISEQNESLQQLADAVSARNEEIIAQSEEISAQSEQVQRHFDLALLTVDSMLSRVGETTLADVPGMTTIRRELLGQAIEFYRRLLTEREGDTGVLMSMARSLQLEGEVLGMLGEIQLGQKSHLESLEIFEELAVRDAGTASYVTDLALALRKLGVQAFQSGRVPEAIDFTARAATVQGRQLAQGVDDFEGAIGFQYVTTLLNLGSMQSQFEQVEPAVESFQLALTIARQLVVDHPGDPRLESVLGRAISGAGKVAEMESDRAAAAELYAEAIEVYDQSLKAFPGNIELRAQVGTLWCLLAFNQTDDYDTAAASYAKGYAIQEALIQDFPESPGYYQQLAFTCLQLAELHQEHGHHELAEGRFREALIRQEILLQHYPELDDLRVDNGRTALSFASWLQSQGRLDEALEMGESSRDQYLSMKADGLLDPIQQGYYDECELLLAEVRSAQELAADRG